MKNLTRSLIGASALLGLGALVQPAYAQSADLYDLQGRQNTNLNAGFHVKVPFGATRKDVASDQARFGLMLSFDRETRDENSFALKRTRTDVMDLGFRFSGEPTMLLRGEDIYTPLFAPIYANETDDEGGTITVSKKKVLIAAGIALTAVAVAVVASSIEGDDDDDDNDHDDDFDHDDD